MTWKSSCVNFSFKTNCYNGARHHVFSQRKPSLRWETAAVVTLPQNKADGKWSREKQRHARRAWNVDVSSVPLQAQLFRVGGLLKRSLWFWALQIKLTWTDVTKVTAISSIFYIPLVWLTLMVVQQFQTHRVTAGVLVPKKQRNNLHRIVFWWESAPCGQHSARYCVWNLDFCCVFHVMGHVGGSFGNCYANALDN